MTLFYSFLLSFISIFSAFLQCSSKITAAKFKYPLAQIIIGPFRWINNAILKYLILKIAVITDFRSITHVCMIKWVFICYSWLEIWQNYRFILFSGIVHNFVDKNAFDPKKNGKLPKSDQHLSWIWFFFWKSNWIFISKNCI